MLERATAEAAKVGLSFQEVTARTSSIGSRARAKLRAKGVIEVRHIAEAGIQRNIEHACRFQQQPCRCPAQASAEDILVRREAGEVAKNAKEMIAAEFRFPGEGTEFMRRIRMILDHSNDSCDARLCRG